MGGARNFPTGEDSSDEGAKIRFQVLYVLKISENIVFHILTEG